MSYGCHEKDEETNGSKALSLLLRLSTLALALTSAVVMATASECTIIQRNGVVATVTYKDFPPFGYLVGFNIVAAVLEAAAIYLQLSKGGGDDDDGEGFSGKLPRILLVVLDVAVQALVYLATGAAFASLSAYGPQIKACGAGAGRFCGQVHQSKLLSSGASAAVGLAVVFRDVSLPFSLWPTSSD
ncbi:CASP-like protein 1U2 [Oryza brachyantha]|uniref:CASP-like protein n=1 Tax=Oryza brachyantha TaxID=4533 RepID=J3N9X7_ORYBR|nr:CASP-like protein 1U2 [Oryza brachyantha]